MADTGGVLSALRSYRVANIALFDLVATAWVSVYLGARVRLSAPTSIAAGLIASVLVHRALRIHTTLTDAIMPF